jgi:arsenate reductase-like glutaredoxin family protein
MTGSRAAAPSAAVQIFGVKSSPAVRAAERFFKERRVPMHFVDLRRKPMAPGEIGRFIDRFGLAGLLDTAGKPYADAGLAYLRPSDSDLLPRIETEPGLLRLPLVRAGGRLSIGHDEATWEAMLAVSFRLACVNQKP